MRAGVGRDEPLRPMRRRAVVIVVLQRLAVIRLLVAEYVAEFADERRVRDQPVPIVVRDLVPEVPEQGPVWLAHLAPRAFAFGIVGFREIDGDEAIVVAG